MKPCNQCGKCCINYSDGGLSATEQELELWELMRPDIYRYVHNGLIWCEPQTGKQLQRCPWLVEQCEEGRTRFSCKIYHDRPEDCRHYPVTVEQMHRDKCEMLDEQDLLDQTRAQTKLDLIMIDSRPAYRRSD